MCGIPEGTRGSDPFRQSRAFRKPGKCGGNQFADVCFDECKGFENGTMDYSLVEVHDGEVPHEALNIAQSLGIDTEWLTLARTLLSH